MPSLLADSRQSRVRRWSSRANIRRRSRKLRFGQTEHSNFGKNTVQIYAPGKPIGALDILGHDASGFDAATSYAAPYVARAIALVEALGGLDADQASHRALLSEWPFYGDDGQPVADITGHVTGVLDLTKAAAVRTYAVEVMERQPDGRIARRTYVVVGQEDWGRLITMFAQYVISEDKWQALAFRAIDSTHIKVTASSRRPSAATFPPPYFTRDFNCRAALGHFAYQRCDTGRYRSPTFAGDANSYTTEGQIARLWRKKQIFGQLKEN